ncbi:acyltransferase [Mucilaginibacter terrigena]|uniref:Acyltransferase n=1 Tax=Mucilaginibacter terrigena TaxID=2492395 RepID=A0A4Q5LKL7_9SPHI|nr:acyltransferase [Mucilaginibacter terrigena]RYU90221.1 acyltransferase [Mucilaginibacter terrigena]
MKRLIMYLYRRFYPIEYARHIGVKVGKNCRLINVMFSTEPYLVTIGDHVSATLVKFETHDGGVWCFRDKEPEIDIVKPIIVGNNVYIGYGALILPGVTIGDNVVIGANAVVSRDIPANSVAVGAPAKVIKTLAEYQEKAMTVGENTKSLSMQKKKEFYLDKYKDLLK